MEFVRNNEQCEQILRRIYLVITLLFTILSGIALLSSVIALALLLCILIVRNFVVYHYSYYDNLGFYSCWLTLDCSLILWPFFVWAVTGYEKIFVASDILGFCILAVGMLCFSFSYFLIHVGSKNTLQRTRIKTNKKIKDNKYYSPLVLWLLSALTLTGLTLNYGIDRMGYEGAVLPYQLNGVIVYGKRVGVVFGAILLIDHFFERRQLKIVLTIVIMFFCWNLIEAYIRLSKGQILTYCIVPMFFWCLSRRLLSWRIVIVTILFMLAIGLSMKQLNLYRISVNTAVTKTQDITYIMANRNRENIYDKGFTFISRVFREAPLLSDFIAYDGYLRGFTPRFEEVGVVGSPTKYKTQILLGADKENRKYASGMSIISEAYFMGGVTLVLLTTYILGCIAALVDSRKWLQQFSHPVGLSLFVYTVYLYMFGGIWTPIYKGVVGVVYPLALFILELTFRKKNSMTELEN